MHVPRNHPDYQKLYREKNREKINAYHREYGKNNREKRLSYEESWRKRNPDKVKEINARSGSKWAKKNKGYKNFYNALRRASIRKATPAWANLEKIKDLYLTAQRISEETGIPHEVDHILPLQGEFISGLHTEDNLEIIPMSNNRSKKNKCEYWWVANLVG